MDAEPTMLDTSEFEDFDEGVELSEDEAEFLLDELEEFVTDVEPGSGDRDEAVRNEMERLLTGLKGIAAPLAADPAGTARIESWTRVLVARGSHDEEGGPEELRALVCESLDDLRTELQRS